MARLNSGIVKKLQGVEPLPGSSITVKDHGFIWSRSNKLVEWRTVMFVKDFEWERPPHTSSHKASQDAESFACPDFVKDVFDVEAIDNIMSSQCIVPFNCVMENSGNWHWGALHCEGVRQGFFIQSKETKALWTKVIHESKKRASRQTNCDDETCDCQSKCEMKQCVLETHPLGRVCRKDVFDQVSDRLAGDVDDESWEDLAANHKRWSLHWFHSVNVFGQAKRKPLPKCFVQCVRHICLDPVGESFVGQRNKSGWQFTGS